MHILLLVSLICSNYFISGKGSSSADIVTVCPQYFQEEQINTVTCAINRKIGSNSTFPNTTVEFRLSLSPAYELLMCSTAFPPTSCVSGKGLCFCASQNADFYIYQYNFKVNPGSLDAYVGGGLKSNLFPKPSKPVKEYVNPTCQNIQFGRGRKSKSNDCYVGCTAAGTCGGGVVITITIVIAYKNKKKIKDWCGK